MTRRPSKLDDPLPGIRCPGCWQSREVAGAKPFDAPGSVSICTRCFIAIVCVAPGRLLRVVPSDWLRLSPAHRHALLERHSRLVTQAAARWRALPRPPRPLQRY